MNRRGIEKGIEQGMVQGGCLVLSGMLSRRFGAIPPEYQQILSNATLEQLVAWTECLMDAETLEEVFEDSK